ncbi:MAG: recombinase family protein, partial [Alphaproteobacteria bacterium]|nr:recombinase family protein [Alphaproteobacteria bacterium]
GWKVVETLYNDGGFSGGSMDRPALKSLISDIERGRVDVVVVYKVDRLTRSLTDFSRLVETFDEKDVSFVSVTQSFNTTTSMGRLTLNVLLSFAQFEREVTAERIRDKFRISKEKGMWMGGRPSLGYDVQHRKLVVNQQEADVVRFIFRRYVALGTVLKLQRELEHRGIRSKQWTTQKGAEAGGFVMRVGGLYRLLQNPIYIGKIRHKELIHEGEHQGIVSSGLWDSVQKTIAANRVTRKHQTNATSPSPLSGLLKDADGNPYRPNHCNKAGKRYRYYVGKALSFPAYEVEKLVCEEISNALCDGTTLGYWFDMNDAVSIQGILNAGREIAITIIGPSGHTKLADLLRKVVLTSDQVEIHLDPKAILSIISLATDSAIVLRQNIGETFVLTRQIHLKQSGHGKRLVIAPGQSKTDRNPDAALLKTLTRAHVWASEMKAGKSYKQIADQQNLDQRYVARTIRLAFLAPDITNSILQGNEPQDVTAERLLKLSILPVNWNEQREFLGFI